jgi:glutamyl-tRNA synthetase
LSKWNEHKNLFFNELMRNFGFINLWNAAETEHVFKEIAAVNQLKPGELMLPLRIMLVGGKYGPGVFDIAAILGKEETTRRMGHSLSVLNEKP